MCVGLPILLGTIARALKDGDSSKWKDAREKLKRFTCLNQLCYCYK